ncbi:ROK family transcriptional regulator [Halobacillus sp. A5]|uniref:ROK family transcriptional regulator n=1 Tax=Halobacillus sp. A5 TaxID=2880263 RepID=UPI0020A6668D|nr:ROK family transcriptional regulator [Halobacillus sp. A5]MCP3027656.1 ROK family transcriptional regulator [Halobacillus sp. A5]
MSTGDSAYIKTLNRRILIENIIKYRSISRSDLARLTGLNKSTVSAQVLQMMKENLIIEKQAGVTSNRGRKPILLEINGKAGYSIGIDFDENSIQIQVTDLLGHSIHSLRLNNKNNTPSKAMELINKTVRDLIQTFNEQYDAIGLIGIGVGIHGIVARSDDIIFTPKMDLSNLQIKQELENTFEVPVFIDNNANLCAYAEQVYTSSVSDLFCITMYSGIGLGILKDSEIYRGFQGFAGEIGHMIVEKHGRECPCGNKGCWELYASEKALLHELEAEGLKLREIDEENVEHITKHYPRLMESFFDYMAVGLNNIINIFNPETIIINGHLLNNNQSLIDELTDRLTSRMNNYDKITSSILGKDACSLGGAMIALKYYYDVQTLDFTAYTHFQNKQLVN